MRIISVGKLKEAAKAHPSIEQKLNAWCSVVKLADWRSLEDVRRVYPSADGVGNFTVFNIKSYRLIVGICYQRQVVYFKYFLSHGDYDRGTWKNDPYFS